MKFRFSFSLKLLVLILPLVCLPAAVVGYFSFQASVERVDRLVRHEQMVKVRAAAAEINDIFYDCRLDLETMAGLPVLEDYHNARSFRLAAEAEFNRDSIVRLFTDFINRTGYYYRIRYIDPGGMERIKVDRRGVAADLADQRDAAVFRKAREAGQGGIHVSGIVPSEKPGGFLVHWSKAVYSGLREFTGVVAVDLDFEKMVGLVRGIHVGERGYAFLVDSLGRNIAHPRFEPLRYDLASYPDDSLRELVREMMSGGSEWKTYVFENEEKLAAFAPIPLMRWSLAVTIPSREFRREAMAIRTRVVQAVAVALIFAVAGVTLLTYYLLKPVRTLVNATHRIADGDLEHEIPIQSRDELGDLTGSFNRMVRNLAKTRNELVRSEKLVSLGRLSAGVAHEVRNPLNAMKGAIVYLQRKRMSDPLIHEYTRLVLEEIDRLSTFVTEFLYFARQAIPKPIATDLNELILSTQALFRERAAGKGIRFHNQLSPALPVTAVDPSQIEQVLVNVLVNAMDAMPDGGDLTFSSHWLKAGAGGRDRVRVTVEDNGEGIPEHALQNIFDPFYSTKESGTGLGLPLSLGIVENHGGTMKISSREGVGTAVVIEWPLSADTGKEAPA